jgi:hypothetical protein
MWASWLEELGGRGAGVLLGLVVGTLTGWVLGRWRRLRERRRMLRGDARDTVVIALHLVERAELPASEGTPARVVPRALRIRSLGQAELRHVVPNLYLATVLLARAHAVTPRQTLISMEGPEGSYLLETLTNFVCDRTANASFDHDLYVMAPCCEPAGLTEHQPITIILIAVSDLQLFEDWKACREVLVEHGIDGARVLTLRELATRYRQDQAELARLRQAGQRTRFVETMYQLDLALDKCSVPIPTRPVPWGRFEPILKDMGLE